MSLVVVGLVGVAFLKLILACISGLTLDMLNPLSAKTSFELECLGIGVRVSAC